MFTLLLHLHVVSASLEIRTPNAKARRLTYDIASDLAEHHHGAYGTVLSFPEIIFTF